MKTSNRSEKLDFRVGNVIGNRIEGNDLATHRSVGKIIIGRWEPNTFGNVHTDSFGCQEGGTHRSERNTRFGLRLREDKEGELVVGNRMKGSWRWAWGLWVACRGG